LQLGSPPKQGEVVFRMGLFRQEWCFCITILDLKWIKIEQVAMVILLYICRIRKAIGMHT
jgi:hypothetical protein